MTISIRCGRDRPNRSNIQHLGWHPLLRVNAGGTFQPAGWVHRHPLTHWVPTVGKRWQGRGTAFGADFARRQALLEIDVLVALALGLPLIARPAAFVGFDRSLGYRDLQK